MSQILPNKDAVVTPSGKFAGATRRKIVGRICGGWGAHGAGAFAKTLVRYATDLATPGFIPLMVEYS